MDPKTGQSEESSLNKWIQRQRCTSCLY